MNTIANIYKCETCNKIKRITDLVLIYDNQEMSYVISCQYCVAEHIILDEKGRIKQNNIEDTLWVKKLLKEL